MNLPPLPLHQGALWLDNSGFVEPFTTCARKLESSFLKKRISSREKSSLSFGSAIHSCMELLYQRYGTGPIDQSYLNDAYTLLDTHFTNNPSDIGEFRTQVLAQEIVKRYVAKYRDPNSLDFEGNQFSLLKYKEPQECVHCGGKGTQRATQKEVLEGLAGNLKPAGCPYCQGQGVQHYMVEMSFALPLYIYRSLFPITGVEGKTNQNTGRTEWDIPVFYCGKIDLPLVRGSQLFVMDHKTTSMLGKTFWIEKALSNQFRGYAFAFQTITGIKVDGFCVNAIKTSTMPESVANGKPATMGKNKGKITSQETWWDEALAREWTLLGPGWENEWKQDTIELVERFFFHYSRGYFPKETTGCTKFGACAYNEVCMLMPPNERDFLLESDRFMDNVWSPLAKVKETL